MNVVILRTESSRRTNALPVPQHRLDFAALDHRTFLPCVVCSFFPSIVLCSVSAITKKIFIL